MVKQGSHDRIEMISIAFTPAEISFQLVTSFKKYVLVFVLFTEVYFNRKRNFFFNNDYFIYIFYYLLLLFIAHFFLFIS